MSETGGDSDCEEWMFYRDRPEWKDVIPIEQDDGPNPVVQIAYSDRFRDVYDYFRAVIKTDERSERAFHLTTDALDLNAANYTVWQYRRILLKDLKCDLREELQYISQMIADHPKNYQVWHHRKAVVEWLGDGSVELDFIANVLRQDSKNYHAWQHRQWVLKAFQLWEHELNYVSRLLVDDLRNNSAWNQRYYVISNTTGFTKEVIDREIEYTTGIIRKAPNNESPWNYLRGLLLDAEMRAFPAVRAFCTELHAQHIRSPYLLAFMLDLQEEALELGGRDDATLSDAKELCQSLADKYDTIRKEYWLYMYRTLDSKYGSAPEQAS